MVSFGPLSDKHEVVADVPADLPLAYGDAMATDIIVGQLLENAFKYSPVRRHRPGARPGRRPDDRG